MRTRILVLLSVAALLASCASKLPMPEQGNLTIACTDSFEPLVTALVDAFQERYPHVAMQVDIRNDANARERLESGKADVALLAGSLDPQPDGWQQRPLALEGLALIVHPSRAVSEVGLAQLQMVFSGRTTSWDALGDAVGEILPVSRENGSAARDAFQDTVLRDKAVTSLAILMPSSAAVVEYVAAHPDAIGYVAAHWAAGVKTLQVEGSLPTPGAAKQGTYPLVMTGYLVWGANPTAEAQVFLDFAASPAGRTIIANAGYAVP
jgi:phosphate transport system substrate-binding protein